MFQGIDALVVPQIEEVDYEAFRTLIKLLPRSHGAWRNYHELALRKRGAGAVVQIVSIAQFRDHIQKRNLNGATPR
jgi:hypothetical protein